MANININIDVLERAERFYCEAAPFGTLALLSDPFGNGFCLLQFSAQGYDALVWDGAPATRA